MCDLKKKIPGTAETHSKKTHIPASLTTLILRYQHVRRFIQFNWSAFLHTSITFGLPMTTWICRYHVPFYNRFSLFLLTFISKKCLYYICLTALTFPIFFQWQTPALCPKKKAHTHTHTHWITVDRGQNQMIYNRTNRFFQPWKPCP